MSRQRFQALPGFHVPYPHALVKLEERETNMNRALCVSRGDRRVSAAGPTSAFHLSARRTPQKLTDPDTMRLDWGLKLQQKT